MLNINKQKAAETTTTVDTGSKFFDSSDLGENIARIAGCSVFNSKKFKRQQWFRLDLMVSGKVGENPYRFPKIKSILYRIDEGYEWLELVETSINQIVTACAEVLPEGDFDIETLAKILDDTRGFPVNVIASEKTRKDKSAIVVTQVVAPEQVDDEIPF